MPRRRRRRRSSRSGSRRARNPSKPAPKPGRPAGVPPKRAKPLPKPPEPEPGRPGSVFQPPPTDVSAPLSPAGLRLPGLRRVVVHGHVRRAPGGRRLASRRGHLRAARSAAARGRGRHRLLGRLERPGRLPALAARPAGEPVLLRPPLGLLAAGRRRERGQGGSGRRLRGQHRRRADARPTISTSRSTRSACCRWATTASSTRSRT